MIGQSTSSPKAAKPIFWAISAAVASLVLVVCAIWSAAFFGVLAWDRNEQLSSSHYGIAAPLNERVSALLEPNAEQRHPQYCLRAIDDGRPRRVDEPPSCAFVRSAYNPPRCPRFERIGNCSAIEIRVEALREREVSELIERTSEFCTYFAGEGSETRVVTLPSCVSPGPGYTLTYRNRTTLCVLVLNDEEPPGRIARFAVRDGRRVRHYWCDRFGN